MVNIIMRLTNKIIGIDIGGTKIRSLLWTGKSVKKVQQFKTPQTKERFISLLKKIIAGYLKNNLVQGIGIGVAGRVKGKLVIACANIPYLKKFDFSKFISAPIKLAIDNDARTFAKAEYFFGASLGPGSILFFTIGTGIGRAYGENNKIRKILRFENPEVWEKEYQYFRDYKSVAELAGYLVKRLLPIIQWYHPSVIVLGGGVQRAQTGKFFHKLKRELIATGVKANIKKTKLGDNASALGACLMLNR
ncbi:MAG: ROK family protein [Patescibacteria group bacterium]